MVTLLLAPSLFAQSTPTPPPTPSPTTQRPPLPGVDIDTSVIVDGEPSAVELLRAEAAKLLPLVTCASAKRLLFACNRLPFMDSGVRIYVRDKDLSADEAAKEGRDFRRMYLSQRGWQALPEEEQALWTPRVMDGYFYYTTKYGSPLASIRALDLLCQQRERDGKDGLTSARVLDFGFGSIGQLRLLATQGCDVVGVDVDPMLQAIYDDPDFLGEVAVAGYRQDQKQPAPGNLRLEFGSWPGDAALRERVSAGGKGGGFDIIISKNTLKRGYIAPPADREVNPRQLIDLGVSREEFVRASHEALLPGGLFMIYNIAPALTPPGEAFKPWSDGRCGFERDMLEAAGFEVLAYDQDDAAVMRQYAVALGWDGGAQAMDLEKDFVVLYTLARKKPAP
jgi:hypothetical protein